MVFLLLYLQVALASAAQTLFTLAPPCEVQSNTTPTNACKRSFSACNEFSAEQDQLLVARWRESFDLAIATGIDIDWGKSTSKIKDQGLEGSEIGAVCDLEKTYGECKTKNKPLKYSGNKHGASTAFHPGAEGDFQVGILNGLRFAAHYCYEKQVVEEMKAGRVKITSPACDEFGKDVDALTRKNQSSQVTYLSSLGKSVRNFCEKKVQIDSSENVAELCRDPVVGVEEVSAMTSRIAACKMAEATKATESAFTFLLSCEINARTERNFLALTYGGKHSIYQQRLEKEGKESNAGQNSANHGKKAKKYAKNPLKWKKAKKEGKKALDALNDSNNGMAKVNWDSTIAIKNEYFSAPDCWEAPDDLAALTKPTQFVIPDAAPAGGGTDDDDGDVEIDSGGTSLHTSLWNKFLFFFSGTLGAFPVTFKRRRKNKFLSLLFLISVASSFSACTQDVKVAVPCFTAGGTPGPAHCCSGGAPVQPPPDGCSKQVGHNIPSDLEAGIAAEERAVSALNDLDAMVGGGKTTKYGGEKLAATAIDSKEDPKQQKEKPTLDAKGLLKKLGNEAQTGAGSGLANASKFGGFNGSEVEATEESPPQAQAEKGFTGQDSGVISFKGGSAPSPSAGDRKISGASAFSGAPTQAEGQELEFGSDRVPAQVASHSLDAEDYFSRIDVLANIFEVVKKRYRKTSADWAIVEAREVLLPQKN